MKRAAIEMALRICRQSTFIYEAQRGQKDRPAPLRMLVKGADIDGFFELLKQAVERCGITALATTAEEHANGEADFALAEECHNDSLMMEHAVLFVKDGPVISDGVYSVVCVAESDKAVELDGADPVELS